MTEDKVYNPTESARRVHASPARTKAVWGPLGCLSGDTEFLTEGRWKRIDAYTPGDRVAEWNPRGGAIEFREPRAYIDQPCAELWSFTNAHGLSMQLSDEHRVPLYDYRGVFVVKSAEEVASHPSRHVVPTTFQPPRGASLRLSDDEIRLRVAINADGHLDGNRVSFSLRKPRKQERLRNLLHALGVPFRETVYEGRPTEARFFFDYPGVTKGYGPEWWSASFAQLGVVLEECLLWDGLADHEERRFFTTDPNAADFIQYAAHATGGRASIASIEYPDNPEWSTCYSVQMTRPGSTKAVVGLRVDTTEIRRVPAPGGRKYCFTTQTGFFLARHNGRVFVTGNSGKSTVAIMEFVLCAMESPVPLLGVVVRGNYRELRDTTRQTIQHWLPLRGVTKWNERDEEYDVFLPNAKGETVAHKLKLRAVQKPEDTQKLQSLEAGFFFLEECVPAFNTQGVMGSGLPEQVLSIAHARLRQPGVKNYRVVCTANPPPPSHWYHKQFIGATDEQLVKANTISVWQPPGENKANLPEGYYEHLRAVFDEDLVRRFVDGEVVASWDGERVFPEAKDHHHVVDGELKPVPGVELILGWDYGLTPSTLITQKTPDGRWLWLRELASFNTSLDQHLEILRDIMKEYYPRFAVRSYGDPAGAARSTTDAKTCFELCEAAGFPVEPGKMDWQSRKEAIKQRLERAPGGEPALLISRQNCPVASEAILGGYRYPKSADGRIGTRPIKNSFSHIMDAAQYIATREFELWTKRSGEIVTAAKQLLPKLDPFRRPVVRGVGGSWMSH